MATMWMASMIFHRNWPDGPLRYRSLESSMLEAEKSFVRKYVVTDSACIEG